MKENGSNMCEKTEEKVMEQIPGGAASESGMNKPEVRRSERFMYLAQVIIPVLISSFLLADQFIKSPVMRWMMVSLSYMMILVPMLYRRIVSKRKLTLRKALEIMNASGLDARIRGNEILWKAGGQINVLRMNGALIQLCREFELEGAEENVRSMEKAATETMREVSLAKVIVSRPSPTSIGLSFLTEAFCSSPRSFSEFLPAYIQVLDVAEERQRFHFKEVKPERRKIGFTV